MECHLHLVKDCVDAIQCCSAASLQKIIFCANQWIFTDEDEKKLATQLKASFDNDNIQQNICYHRRCYMRFVDKRRINAAIKRKQKRNVKVTESKEKSTKSSEIPLKPKVRINSSIKSVTRSTDASSNTSSKSVVTRSKSVPSKLCIICKKKLDKMHYLQKETRQILEKKLRERIDEKLIAYEKNSDLLLKAALQKKDKEMLLQIRGKGLVAKKVCYHHSCYIEYTYFLTRPVSVSKKDKRQMSFSKFCRDIIEKKITEEKKIWPMDVIKDLFVKTVLEEENVELRNYTNGNLKKKLEVAYPLLVFAKLPIRNHCELVLHANTLRED